MKQYKEVTILKEISFIGIFNVIVTKIFQEKLQRGYKLSVTIPNENSYLRAV